MRRRIADVYLVLRTVVSATFHDPQWRGSYLRSRLLVGLVGGLLFARLGQIGLAQNEIPPPVALFLEPAVVAAGQQGTATDRYIVRLVEGQVGAAASRASTIALVANQITAEYGATVHHIYSHVFPGLNVSLSPAAAAALANDPRVAAIEPDQLLSIAASQSPAPWGLDRIDQRDLPLDDHYSYEGDGAGVHVYIMDTGIRTTHVEFAGRIGLSGYTINDGRGIEDCNGHGTHVAGTVGGTTYGVAKGVTLHILRVLDCDGVGPNSGVIAAVDWVTANHISPAVVNMSLGGAVSPSLDTAVRNSIAAGVTYVIAAGNENEDACASSPARVVEAITVGASDKLDQRAFFSNYGTCVDLFAPGHGIVSAYHTSDQATTTMSGTSMAAPHAAGVVALYLAGQGESSPELTATTILDQATTGRLTNLGTGSPDRLLYSWFGEPATPTATPTHTATPTATDTATLTPTGTATATPTATATDTATATATEGSPPVPTSTETPTTVPGATDTATATATVWSTEPATPTPSATATPTVLPDSTATATFTPSPTATGAAPVPNDLAAFDHELWVSPQPPRQGVAGQLGLLIHRTGGDQLFSDVVVRFFEGDPAAGGSALGDAAIALPSGGSTSTGGISWLPDRTGAVELFAVIDPDNQLVEADETNNTARRSVAVLPPNADSQPPLVSFFSLNNGAPVTSQRQITATVLAADPGIPASGVAHIFLLEYRWDRDRRSWSPHEAGGVWLPYGEANGQAALYPWQLAAAPGVAYLQVWAADRAGNITAAPRRATINYIPPLIRLGAGETLVYRLSLAAGDQLLVRVEPDEGDPDLYLWAPDYETRPPWVSNASGAVADQLSVSAPVSGRYQLEIDGYTATTFTLALDLAPAVAASWAGTDLASDAGKPLRSAPSVPPDAAPAEHYALQPPEAIMPYNLRLPLVLR